MTIEQRLLLVAICWLVVGWLGWIWFRRFWQRGQARQRFQVDDGRSMVAEREPEQRPNWIGRYLRLAGFSHPLASTYAVVVVVAMLLIGLSSAWLFRISGLQQQMLTGVELIPGGLAGVMVPVVLVAPWLLAVIVASLPIVIIRSRRRQRVSQVNRDLPLALDLWATLSESGLGFDAALDRWLQTQTPKQALASEARRYQRDLLAGMRRVEALRRWGSRLEIPSVTRFVGAMIQSEQSGASISETLRLQAEDSRAERREKSLSFAQSLATKRVIPLVICFLPGLFIWPLGPFFVELLRIVDQLTAVR